MFVSRSSFEKPRPFERLVRITSPSNTSTLCPRAINSVSISRASVDLPAPESPVNHSVNPFCSICSPVRLRVCQFYCEKRRLRKGANIAFMTAVEQITSNAGYPFGRSHIEADYEED